jgi:hypothetical protein
MNVRVNDPWQQRTSFAGQFFEASWNIDSTGSPTAAILPSPDDNRLMFGNGFAVTRESSVA